MLSYMISVRQGVNSFELYTWIELQCNTWLAGGLVPLVTVGAGGWTETDGR